jgi:hypothetical protein
MPPLSRTTAAERLLTTGEILSSRGTVALLDLLYSAVRTYQALPSILIQLIIIFVIIQYSTSKWYNNNKMVRFLIFFPAVYSIFYTFGPSQRRQQYRPQGKLMSSWLAWSVICTWISQDGDCRIGRQQFAHSRRMKSKHGNVAIDLQFGRFGRIQGRSVPETSEALCGYDREVPRARSRIPGSFGVPYRIVEETTIWKDSASLRRIKKLDLFHGPNKPSALSVRSRKTLLVGAQFLSFVTPLHTSHGDRSSAN